MMEMINGIPNSPQEYKLNLILYAATASQEVARGDLAHDSIVIGNQWHNCSTQQPTSENQPVLRDVITVRQEEDPFGFVLNKNNGMVFVADTKTLQALASLANTPIGQLSAQHPEVLQALNITL